MGHIGIIAEYNPFHNGHQYQINEIKKSFPDKKIVVIMSGNYVQRGEPAIFNKWLRTSMALSCGADLVIELPTMFSCASAEYFSRGAIITLAKTGIIDTLCFGSECEELSLLAHIAQILTDEPSIYRQTLLKELKNGHSYPVSRAMALQTFFPKKDILTILKKPNNILAIEYLKTILQFQIPIKPYLVKRSHDNYHSLDMSESICSASALRNGIKDRKVISAYIPYNAYETYIDNPFNQPLFLQDLFPWMQYSLLEKKNHLRDYQDITKDIANRINNIEIMPNHVNDLISILSNKSLTQTRMKRCLLHTLLDMKQCDIPKCMEDYSPYVRLLGFNVHSTLPKELKDNCTIPIITKTANANKLLSHKQLAYFERQLQMDQLYCQAYMNKYDKILPNDYRQSVIRVNRE